MADTSPKSRTVISHDTMTVLNRPTIIRLDLGGECELIIGKDLWLRCRSGGSWRPLGQILTRDEKSKIGWGGRPPILQVEEDAFIEQEDAQCTSGS